MDGRRVTDRATERALQRAFKHEREVPSLIARDEWSRPARYGQNGIQADRRT